MAYGGGNTYNRDRPSKNKNNNSNLTYYQAGSISPDGRPLDVEHQGDGNGASSNLINSSLLLNYESHQTAANVMSSMTSQRRQLLNVKEKDEDISGFANRARVEILALQEKAR